MTIPEELRNELTVGDYTLIAEKYAEKHASGEGADYKTVTSKYVSMVLNGEREANEGTAAEEIIRIAIAYLTHKRNFWSDFLMV